MEDIKNELEKVKEELTNIKTKYNDMVIERDNYKESFEACLIDLDEMRMEHAGEKEYILTLESKLRDLGVEPECI